MPNKLSLRGESFAPSSMPSTGCLGFAYLAPTDPKRRRGEELEAKLPEMQRATPAPQSPPLIASAEPETVVVAEPAAKLAATT